MRGGHIHLEPMPPIVIVFEHSRAADLTAPLDAVRSKLLDPVMKRQVEGLLERFHVRALVITPDYYGVRREIRFSATSCQELRG